MTSYIADELANKVKYLQVALSQAEDIINQLENENNILKDVLMGLTSKNKENPPMIDESVCV
ncbi:hypothetical protein EBS40_02765 [bacterium]|nr:hypothetical protein [bacterium]